MKRAIRMSLVVLVLGAFVAAGLWYLWDRTASAASTTDETGYTQVVAVEQGSLAATISVVGQLESAQSSYTMDDYASHPVWAAAGVAYASDVVSWPQPPVYRWAQSHPAVNGWPTDPLQFEDFYEDNGDRFDALPTARTLAGYTAAPEAGQGAYALRSDNQVQILGFNTDGLAYRDEDGDGTSDCTEVWQGAVSWLLHPASDVAWLSEEPAAGSVPAGAELKVEITFSAALAMEPGSYTATLLLLSSDPVSGTLTVPATLHVAKWKIYLPAIYRSNH